MIGKDYVGVATINYIIPEQTTTYILALPVTIRKFFFEKKLNRKGTNLAP